MRTLLLLLASVLTAQAAPVVTSITDLGEPVRDAGVVARDLGVTVARSGQTAIFWGDTLGTDANATVVVESCSWGLQPANDPLHPTTVTNAATGVPVQCLPFTAAELAYNAAGHSDRYGRYVLGATPLPNDATALWYVVMLASGSPWPKPQPPAKRSFYSGFLIQKIGAALLLAGGTQGLTYSEGAYPSNAFPTGFHVGHDGLVHFFVEYVSDAQPNAPIVAARVAQSGLQYWTGSTWSPNIASGLPLYTLDAVEGFSVVWNPHYNAWLLSYVDSHGSIVLRTLADETAIPSAPATVVSIQGWYDNWDGYAGYQITGMQSPDGKTIGVTFSSANWIFASVRNVYQVTLQ
jgi:hypothetical protein